MQDNPTNICIRYCVHNPRQPATKPRWGDCDGAYKVYFDQNLYTSSDKDPYKQVLNHFKKEMDDNNDCNTKLVEYNHSFFFYDPHTKSSPYRNEVPGLYVKDITSDPIPTITTTS